MSTNNKSDGKIKRARISADVKARILDALQNRTEDDTLKTIATRFNVSIGTVAVVADQNGLTKKRASTDTEV